MKQKHNNSTHKILVVDDDPDITFTFKRGLEDNKDNAYDDNRFKVDTYNDPLLALSAFKADLISSPSRSSSYDLLLLDIKMPNMNGFELYQELREITGRDIKTCFITAHEVFYETLKTKFPSLDIGCFIKKPIEIDILKERIRDEIIKS
jgi:DNA-binding response OmpR family regulator